jgi:hypothetical protein
MNWRFCLLMLLLILPAALFSQIKQDTGSFDQWKTAHPMHTVHPVHRYQVDSTFSILFDVSAVFSTAKDSKIDNFLTKYGYAAPQNIPVGINFELAAIPFDSKMMYCLSGGTIVSRQDIKSTIFKAAAYRQFFERRHFWISGGLGLGIHGSRIFLNGKMPPSFDSVANLYNRELVLKRNGFEIEPGVRFFWYPIQTRKFQLGLFANTAYDLSFNSRWKLGYYNPSGQFSSFKSLSKRTGVQAQHEFGWAFSDGLSFRFKFD